MPVTSTPDAVPDAIRRQLGAGEQVLWHGHPRHGLLLRRGDALIVPFGLLCVGLGLRMGRASASAEPLAVLLLVVGAYLAVGRFLVDAHARTRIWYAVTGERILIVSGIRVRRIQSLNLAGLTALQLEERRSGEGTIVFGAARPTPAFGRRRAATAHGTQAPAPRFDAIPDARHVHALILSLQHRAHGPGFDS